MNMTLTDKSVAILAAGGFDENQMTALQRALTKAKAPYKVIAPEQGLVNGWQNNAWGHYFTVDAQINTALGSDFDALVILGGEKGVTKLKSNPHVRRIINHFMEAGKPVAAIEAGISLLALSPKSAGRSVAACDLFIDEVRAGQMETVSEPMHQDDMILTANGDDIEAWVEAAMKLFHEAAPFEDEQVAA